MLEKIIPVSSIWGLLEFMATYFSLYVSAY